MDNRYLLKAEDWFNHKTHKNRLYILFLGSALIFFFWYFLLEKPLSTKETTLVKLTTSADTQREVFEKESVALLAQVKKNKLLTKMNQEELQKSGLKFASGDETSQVIQQILGSHPNISFESWKEVGAKAENDKPDINKKPNNDLKNAYQLTINSDYFSTRDYLESLEKLPWCLAWDSLEYKVVKYPEATITINLRIINSW